MRNQNIVKSLPVAQLVSLMANNEVHTTTSQRAYTEFIQRYENDLKDICKAVCGKNNFSKIKDLDKEVFEISTEEFYLHSKSMPEINSKLSSAQQEKVIFAHFGKIAEKAMKMIIAEDNQFEKRHLLVPDYHDHLIKSDQNDEDQLAEEEMEKDVKERREMQKLVIFQKAMSRLKPREREIILEYYVTNNGCKNLPDDRIAYLCKKWKVTVDNLQHIKLRAVQKLNKFCRDEQEKARFGTYTTNT